MIEPDAIADRIYEASVLPEFWPGLLQEVAGYSDTAWATLVAVPPSGIPQWATSSPDAEEIVRAHFEHFGDNMRTARLLAKPHAGFITDFDILSQAEIDAEPVYQEFLIPRGYGFGVGTSISQPTGEMIVVHCENLFSSGAVSREVVQRLDDLRPHLARSALLSVRLAFERERTAVETLSSLGMAACAVGRTGVVLVANREFDAEKALWTTRGANRIALLDRRADRLLHEALGMIATGQGVRSLPVTAGEGGLPAVLHAVPVRRSAHDLFAQASAILVLSKACDQATTATPLLQALFDLTPTEAAVAARIAAGETAERIALADAKSADTVRGQLKSVLAKTGCHRQVDLARLLTQLAPPARR